MNHDKYKINFLDILIKGEGGILVTDLYRKDTDKCSFLYGESFHPTYLKKSLPISQFSHIRICTKETDYNKQADELKQETTRTAGFMLEEFNKKLKMNV